MSNYSPTLAATIMALNNEFTHNDRLNAQDVKDLDQLLGGLLDSVSRAQAQGGADSSAAEAGGLVLH